MKHESNDMASKDTDKLWEQAHKMMKDGTVKVESFLHTPWMQKYNIITYSNVSFLLNTGNIIS